MWLSTVFPVLSSACPLRVTVSRQPSTSQGAFGLGRRPITRLRLAAVAVTYLGTVLTQEPFRRRRKDLSSEAS